jgi:hypothetical protein
MLGHRLKVKVLRLYKSGKASVVGYVKVNWNAMVDKAKSKMDIKVIVRDHKGEVWETLLAPRQHIFDPVMAEVTAALTEIFLLGSWDINK